MSVQSQVSSVTYQGDNVTTIFNYPFRILNASDLLVYLQDQITGLIINLTYNVDYTVSGVNVVTGGQVTFLIAPTATQILFIGRVNQPYSQPMTFNNNQAFSLPSLEQDLDAFALADQQLNLKSQLVSNNVTSLTAEVSGIQTHLTTIDGQIVGINNEINYIEGEISKFGSLPQGTFIQGGTSAIVRGYQDKVRETVSVLDFGAVGDGITDDTIAIQNAINFAGLRQGQLEFVKGKNYLIKSQLTLFSNISLIGNKCNIISGITVSGSSIFLGSNITNLNISDFNFNMSGMWTSTPFPNPYAAGNSVGFTNNTTAIILLDCSYADISDNNILGFSIGVKILGGNEVNTRNNRINNCGTAGVYYAEGTVNPQSSNCIIQNNFVSNVLGNLTTAGDTNISNSKFADGIYAQNVYNLNILNNQVFTVSRIGITIEGLSIGIQNEGVVINDNIVKNCNNAQGTEYNAGIWVEPGKTSDVVINNNVLDNTIAGATNGSNPPIGIRSDNATISNNYVRGWAWATPGIGGNWGSGINAYINCIVTNNTVLQCDWGIFLTRINYVVSNNTVSRCNSNGIISVIPVGTTDLGYINISNNQIINNAVNETSAIYQCGINIWKTYSNIKLTVKCNTFISSCNTGATLGQVYGIIAIAGGDTALTTKYIHDNEFIFTGAIDIYPANFGVAPACMGYSGGATINRILDFSTANNNICNKIPDDLVLYNNNAAIGMVKNLGYALSAPTTGNWLVGDLYLNGNVTSGAPIGWICTAAGSPGIWVTYGTIGS